MHIQLVRVEYPIIILMHVQYIQYSKLLMCDRTV